MKRLLQFLLFQFIFFNTEGGGSFMGGGDGGSGGEGAGDGGGGSAAGDGAGGEGGGGASGDGAGAGTGGEGAGSSTGGEGAGSSTGGGTGEKTYTYPTGLDETYHGNATLLKYANDDGTFDNAKIAQALIHASSFVGADKIMKPNDKYTKEQWDKHYRDSGLPEKFEDYKVANNVPQGIEANEEMFNAFAKTAYEHGLLPQQAQAVMDFHNEYMGTAVNSQNEAFNNKVEADRQALHSEWGVDQKRNYELAEIALGHFCSPEQKLSLIKSGALDNVEVTRLFQRMGAGLGEDTLQKLSGGTLGMDSVDLDKRITDVSVELRSLGRTHPQYKGKMAEYQRLLDKRHGTNQVPQYDGQGADASVTG